MVTWSVQFSPVLTRSNKRQTIPSDRAMWRCETKAPKDQMFANNPYVYMIWSFFFNSEE